MHYEKKTKKDLLMHPVMAQLQTCNSPESRSCSSLALKSISEIYVDPAMTNWLNSTVNVLFAFSSTLASAIGPGAGLDSSEPVLF